MRTPQRILDDALAIYKPSTIVLLTSWGHDSQVSTDIAWRWSRKHAHSARVVVVTLDTGVSADGYTEWVTDQARQRHYTPFRVWSNPDVGFQWYANDAINYGFGYTRNMHNLYYRMLKERTIAKVLKHYKKHWHDRVMFVTGVYAAESNTRADTPEFDRRKAAVWCNPIVHWSTEQIAQYRIDNDLPQNPFYDTVGGSGDCQCNWGQFADMPTLQKHSPRLALKLLYPHREAQRVHGWGWGEKPSSGLLAERFGQMVLPGIEPLDDSCAPDLCAGCKRTKPKHNTALDNVMMQRFDWSAA